MFEKFYEIMGVTSKMLEGLGDDVRSDAIIWTDDDGIAHVHVKLNPFEALKMKYQIYRNNHKTEPHYYFKLVRVQ